MTNPLNKIKEKIQDVLDSFYCDACGKKCNNKEQAKYSIYLEKWFEKDAKSSTECKLCPECAAPVVDVVKKAKAFAALKKKEISHDPHSENKPYHFDN